MFHWKATLNGSISTWVKVGQPYREGRIILRQQIAEHAKLKEKVEFIKVWRLFCISIWSKHLGTGKVKKIGKMIMSNIQPYNIDKQSMCILKIKFLICRVGPRLICFDLNCRPPRPKWRMVLSANLDIQDTPTSENFSKYFASLTGHYYLLGKGKFNFKHSVSHSVNSDNWIFTKLIIKKVNQEKMNPRPVFIFNSVHSSQSKSFSALQKNFSSKFKFKQTFYFVC